MLHAIIAVLEEITDLNHIQRHGKANSLIVLRYLLLWVYGVLAAA